MEPKLNNLPTPPDLPPEPRLRPVSKHPKIPHIVPADMRKSVITHSAETAKDTPKDKDPLKLMAELSAQVNEMSSPRKETEGSFEIKGASDIEYPRIDDLGDPRTPPSSSGALRSILSLICLLFVIVAAWQVTLFLQPEILKKEPLSTLSEKSCQYFYCPALRVPVVLRNQLDATGNNTWVLKLKLQNQDVRSQELPTLRLTIESTGKNSAVLTFEPSSYKVEPKVSRLSGGETVQIEVPFDFAEGLPSGFNVTVLPQSGQQN